MFQQTKKSDFAENTEFLVGVGILILAWFTTPVLFELKEGLPAMWSGILVAEYSILCATLCMLLTRAIFGQRMNDRTAPFAYGIGMCLIGLAYGITLNVACGLLVKFIPTVCTAIAELPANTNVVMTITGIVWVCVTFTSYNKISKHV